MSCCTSFHSIRKTMDAAGVSSSDRSDVAIWRGWRTGSSSSVNVQCSSHMSWALPSLAIAARPAAGTCRKHCSSGSCSIESTCVVALPAPWSSDASLARWWSWGCGWNASWHDWQLRYICWWARCLSCLSPCSSSRLSAACGSRVNVDPGVLSSSICDVSRTVVQYRWDLVWYPPLVSCRLQALGDVIGCVSLLHRHRCQHWHLQLPVAGNVTGCYTEIGVVRHACPDIGSKRNLRQGVSCLVLQFRLNSLRHDL